jgi:hypothetical protein
MLRVAATLVVTPVLLVVLLGVWVDLSGGRLGTLSHETFELGMLPLVILVSLFMLVVFLPLVALASRFAPVSMWSSAAAGLLSAILPVAFSTWSVVTDERLRLGFRLERLADSCPWLVIGVVGGLLFWVLAVFRNPALDRWQG